MRVDRATKQTPVDRPFCALYDAQRCVIVNNRNFRDTHAELLRKIDTDLLALQEVSPGFYQELTDTGLFDWSAFSLSLRPPQREEGRSRRLGCAVFARSPFQIYSAQLIEELPFPERALIVKINSAVEMMMCSFHTPPGASWEKLSRKHYGRSPSGWGAKRPHHLRNRRQHSENRSPRVRPKPVVVGR
jgi:hypothetical protein